jgi:hypothetical protein
MRTFTAVVAVSLLCLAVTASRSDDSAGYESNNQNEASSHRNHQGSGNNWWGSASNWWDGSTYGSNSGAFTNAPGAGGASAPPSIMMARDVTTLAGLTIEHKIYATDTDGMKSLVVSACSDSDVTCTRISTPNSITLTLSTIATRNFTALVTAEDKANYKAVSMLTVLVNPRPVKPATSKSFTFTLSGSHFNAANVYENRHKLAADIAKMINKYNGVSRRQTPTKVLDSDITVASVTAVVGGISVEIYIAGADLTESASRLAALQAQPSLSFPETFAALAVWYGSGSSSSAVSTTMGSTSSSPVTTASVSGSTSSAFTTATQVSGAGSATIIATAFAVVLAFVTL